MKQAPSPWNREALVLLALRVSTASLMIGGHGLPKIMNFSTGASHFPDPLGIGSEVSMICAILTEVGCSLLVLMGFFTRLACTGILFTLGTIGVLVHRYDTWPQTEPSVLFAVLYATILCFGAGSLSLDAHLLGRPKAALKL